MKFNFETVRLAFRWNKLKGTIARIRYSNSNRNNLFQPEIRYDIFAFSKTILTDITEICEV